MTPTINHLVAIAAGGAAGALVRYGAGVACARVWGERFGYGTLLVNALGCLAIGVLMHEAWLSEQRLTPHAHAGLTIGLLGGLTTFSTFGYQTVRHVETGEPVLALLNVGANVVVGLSAAAAGLAIARAMNG